MFAQQLKVTGQVVTLEDYTPVPNVLVSLLDKDSVNLKTVTANENGEFLFNVEKADQKKTIDAQADQLNEAYVIIGTKKELKQAGLMTGGNLFKKSKLDMNQVNASAFKKIDIRNVKSFNIPKSLTRYSPICQQAHIR